LLDVFLEAVRASYELRLNDVVYLVRTVRAVQPSLTCPYTVHAADDRTS